MKYPVYIPEITAKEKQYVNDCLDSTWISSKGKFVEQFEESFKKYIGSDYAVPVFNGTVALHLALVALDIQEGDEVIVPDFTYIASANAVLYTGATPILVDVDPDTWNVTLPNLKEIISPATKAIIITDIYGTPPEMDEIMQFAREQNIYIIADSAESVGATYKSKRTGNIADISMFSFFGNKTITTGEGGMITTNDEHLYKKLNQLKNQGNHESIRYYHDVLGYNYRMTNIQAAIGCAQLERIDKILSKKREIFQTYQRYLSDFVKFQEVGEHMTSSYWLVSFLLPDNVDRDALMEYLESKGIESRPFFKPVQEMPHFNAYKTSENPVTKHLSDHGISVPSYPQLTESDVRYICTNLIEFLTNE